MYLIIGNHLIILYAWPLLYLMLHARLQASEKKKADEVSLKSSSSGRAYCGVLSFLLAFSMLAFVKACMCICMGYTFIVLL